MEKVQESPCVEVLAVPGVGEGLHIWIDRCSSPSRREGITLLWLEGGGRRRESSAGREWEEAK